MVEPAFTKGGRDRGLLREDRLRDRADAKARIALQGAARVTCGGLGRLLAVLAPRGERQRAQTLLGDLLLAVPAHPVLACFESPERRRNLLHRLRLHLYQREIDVLLDLVLGELGS